MSRNWLAVASADHVRIGRAQGFIQVGHGKAAPLRRINLGDKVVYYSPTEQYGSTVKFRFFTALGTVKPGEPYQADMGGGFMPFRRDVQWAKASEAAITPLLETLEFTAGKRYWGYQLRFGLFEISHQDIDVIAVAMKLRGKL